MNYFEKYGQDPKERQLKHEQFKKAMNIEIAKQNKQEYEERKAVLQNRKDFKNKSGDYTSKTKRVDGNYYYIDGKEQFILYKDLTEEQKDYFTEQGFEKSKHTNSSILQTII